MTDKPEHTIFSIRPTLHFVRLGYLGAVFGGILVVVLLYYFEQLVKLVFADFSIPYYVSVPLGLSLLLFPAISHLKRNLVAYTLTDAKIQIDEGLISRRTRNIPLRTIQDVTVSASILQRIFGYGNLIIENANESDGKIKLKNIPAPKKHADLLLNEMRKD